MIIQLDALILLGPMKKEESCTKRDAGLLSSRRGKATDEENFLTLRMMHMHGSSEKQVPWQSLRY
jgi:hypothetical protein